MYHRLEAHDTNQLELKLAYRFDPKRRRQRYRVESFLFIPRSLGLDRSTYPKERFYEDTAAFVRLKTPQVALHVLGRKAGARWFDEAGATLDRLLAGDAGASGAAVRKLKLLGCIFKAALRDEGEALQARFAGLAGSEGGTRTARREEVARALDGFLADVDAAVGRLRALAPLAEAAAVEARVAAVWRAVDEFVALSVEEVCTALVAEADRVSDPGEADALKAVRVRLAATAVEAYRYRRGKGYPSFVDPGAENEQLPYRRRLLKRTVSSVLYLDVYRAPGGALWTNVIGAIAAATAMLFAVVVTLWATARYDMFSLAFVLVAVGSYMIKDRIKALGGEVLRRRLGRLVPDHEVRVIDRESDEATLGSARETVVMGDSAGLDDEVLRLRYLDHKSPVAEDGRPESVVCWTKDVTLSSRRLADRLEGVDAINDIIRFNFHRMRERMDAAYENHRIVDPTTRKVVDVRCARVYHLNLVLRLTSGRGPHRTVEVDRVRVVIDQRGIKRIEPLGDHPQALPARAASPTRPTEVATA